MNLESLLARIFAGKEGAEEKQHLYAWKQDYRDNLEGLNKLSQIWTNAEELKDYQAFNSDKAFDKFQSKIALSKPRKIQIKRRLVYSFAAIGVILVCISLVFKYYLQNPYEKHFSADTNQTLILPDGSSALVFKGSKISYASNFKSERKLTIDGEAFFKVVRDPSKPLILNTDQAEIKVLGTSFLVREFEQHTSVGVAEGKVLVSNGKEEHILMSGDKFDIRSDQISPSAWEESDARLVPNFILANGENIDELFKMVFHDTNMSYSFMSKIPDCRINAFFYNQTIADIMQEISLICGFSYLQEAEIFIIK